MAKFYGIGVGPGDEELLTLKAVKVLGLLDVVLIPQTKKGQKGVAETIIKNYLKERTEKIYVYFPMVKDEEVFNEAGKEAAQRVQEALKQGKNIGFVTLGDATIYSTYGYILKHLPKDTPIETISGIPSFCAAAALANTPLVEKDEVFALIPMNASDEQIEKVLPVGDAFAFLKVYKREKRVSEHLTNHELDKKSLLACRCGFEDATLHTDALDALKENQEYLSLVLARREQTK
jgi:precorrin-2/cobalt-factor-2 C20-methyltransferase